MSREADLHIHTVHSDGTFLPQEIVERAKALQLCAVSITDHDTVGGIGQARQAAESSAGQAPSTGSGQVLEIISGVELTALFKDRELHLLGYGIREADPGLLDFLGRMKEYRRRRIQAMIEQLAAHGVRVRFEEVCSVAKEGVLGRPHLAEVLVKKGFVGSIEEAFRTYIGDRAPCFVKGSPLTVPEAVKIIRSAGGVPVLAHPHRIVEDSWIPELVACGIQGIEVYHSDHSPSVSEKYRRIAQDHRLLITGGSDCHGLRKSKGPLLGSVRIPYEQVERLKQAIERCQATC